MYFFECGKKLGRGIYEIKYPNNISDDDFDKYFQLPLLPPPDLFPTEEDIHKTTQFAQKCISFVRQDEPVAKNVFFEIQHGQLQTLVLVHLIQYFHSK
jgi:hypothetical protein